MNVMTALQPTPVNRVDPGEDGNVFGMAGLGVYLDQQDFVITITDSKGLSLSARLTEHQLRSFASRLALTIEQKTVRDFHPVERLRMAGDSLVRSIIFSVAKCTGLGINDIVGHRRERHIVRARDAAIWAARTASTCSFPELAEIFGNRDHSSIHQAFRRANEMRETDRDFRAFTDGLMAAITGDEPAAPTQPGDTA